MENLDDSVDPTPSCDTFESCGLSSTSMTEWQSSAYEFTGYDFSDVFDDEGSGDDKLNTFDRQVASQSDLSVSQVKMTRIALNQAPSVLQNKDVHDDLIAQHDVRPVVDRDVEDNMHNDALQNIEQDNRADAEPEISNCSDDNVQSEDLDGITVYDSFKFCCSRNTCRVYLYDKVTLYLYDVTIVFSSPICTVYIYVLKIIVLFF